VALAAVEAAAAAGYMAVEAVVDGKPLEPEAVGTATLGTLAQGALGHIEATGGGALPRVPREKASVTRTRWEKETGRKWPLDPRLGRNQDISHKKALADGGDNSVSNVEPKPHDEHMSEHMEAGDFRRWGARAQQGKKKEE
jgi:hypothetical protein